MEHFYIQKAWTKERWVGIPLIDLLTTEFLTRDKNYYLKAISAGAIEINDKKAAPNQKLKHGDVISHLIHLHEPEQPKIEIISDEGDYIVVNKPSGIPCHPVGYYRKYCVTKTLFSDEKVGCINRLDIPVSGVLIVARDNKAKVTDMLQDATKIYIAKVKGEFPEYVEVEEPILVDSATKTCSVSPDGKYSKTIFSLLKYENGHSIVKCQPITGRTHQIRVHIKHLGYPINNDTVYGGLSEENMVKKQGNL